MKAVFNLFLGALLALSFAGTAEAGKVKIFNSYEEASISDRQVARSMRSYDREGWVEVSREMQFVNYFATPTSDYNYGEMVITMRLSSSEPYDLTTYYDQFRIVLYKDIETGGFYVHHTYVESQVVY